MFASSLFVPVETLPGWLEPIAPNSPVSAVADAIRALRTGSTDTTTAIKPALWLGGVLLVFVPLARIV